MDFDDTIKLSIIPSFTAVEQRVALDFIVYNLSQFTHGTTHLTGVLDQIFLCRL